MVPPSLPRDPSPGTPIEIRDGFITQGRLNQDYNPPPGTAPRDNVPFIHVPLNELVNILEVADDLSVVRVRRTATIVPGTIDIPVPQNERMGWISYDSIRAVQYLDLPYAIDLGLIISLEEYGSLRDWGSWWYDVILDFGIQRLCEDLRSVSARTLARMQFVNPAEAALLARDLGTISNHDQGLYRAHWVTLSHSFIIVPHVVEEAQEEAGAAETVQKQVKTGVNEKSITQEFEHHYNQHKAILAKFLKTDTGSLNTDRGFDDRSKATAINKLSEAYRNYYCQDDEFAPNETDLVEWKGQGNPALADIKSWKKNTVSEFYCRLCERYMEEENIPPPGGTTTKEPIDRPDRGRHWTFLLIVHGTGNAFHYDSVKGFNNRFAQMIIDNINAILNTPMPINLYHVANYPQQRNSFECGPRALRAMGIMARRVYNRRIFDPRGDASADILAAEMADMEGFARDLQTEVDTARALMLSRG